MRNGLRGVTLPLVHASGSCRMAFLIYPFSFLISHSSFLI